MKELFYKRASIILTITTLIFGISSYFLDDYLFGYVHSLFCIVIILIEVVGGFLSGRIVEKLHLSSYKDSLTGLTNRRYFYEILAYEMKKVKRTNSPLSLAIIDVDNFKNINDTYGHIEGDKVLMELANIFTKYARANDTISRWGGEEFAIILPETDSKGAAMFAERIRSVVEACNFYCKVTVCVGIASTTTYIDVDKFINLADKALYRAKEKKNLVVSADGPLLLEITDFSM